jgi:antitoxin ParD1/3/4
MVMDRRCCEQQQYWVTHPAQQNSNEVAREASTCVAGVGNFMLTSSMTITLKPEQEAWLASHVANGDFPSIEDAARQLIDERIAERAAILADDLAWAKPYVDEAMAEVARGDVISREEHDARTEARLATLI